MTRPNTFADWATESENITAPPQERIRIGWQMNDRPPSSYFNWWKNLAGRWIRYLDGTLGELVTETNERINALSEQITTLENSVNGRLDEIERKLNDPALGMAAIDSRFLNLRLRARFAIDSETVFTETYSEQDGKHYYMDISLNDACHNIQEASYEHHHVGDNEDEWYFQYRIILFNEAASSDNLIPMISWAHAEGLFGSTAPPLSYGFHQQDDFSDFAVAFRSNQWFVDTGRVPKLQVLFF